MFHVQEGQFSFSSLFKKPVHNAVRPFSCLNRYLKANQDLDEAFDERRELQQIVEVIHLYSFC